MFRVRQNIGKFLLTTIILTHFLYINKLTAADTLYNVYVVDHGWHTGIILKTSQIDSTRFEIIKYLPQGWYIEFGWGDADFYQNPSMEVDYWLAFKAAVIPTKSVMHIVAFDTEPQKYFGYSKLVVLSVDSAAFEKMLHFIVSHFERNEQGNITPLGKGLYGNSRFYKSDRIYIFPKTCNVWTAQALKKAGLPLSPYSFQKSSSIMEELKKHGKVIR